MVWRQCGHRRNAFTRIMNLIDEATPDNKLDRAAESANRVNNERHNLGSVDISA